MLLQFGGYVFKDALLYLQYLGLWDVLIPFALLFAVMYAVLEKTGVFTKKNVNVTIAVSIALLAVIPHVTGGYPPGLDIVLIINAFFPQIALVIVSIVMVLILTGLISGNAQSSQLSSKLSSYAAWISIGIVLFFMLNSLSPFSQTWGPSFSFLNDPQLQAFVISALVFGLVVYFVTRGFGGGEEGRFNEQEEHPFTFVPIMKKK